MPNGYTANDRIQSHNKIMVRQIASPRREEAKATGVITPGAFVVLNVDTTGKGNTATAASAGNTDKLIALEDFMNGKTWRDDHATDDLVQVEQLLAGDMVNTTYVSSSTDAVVGENVSVSANGAVTKTADNGTDRIGVITSIVTEPGETATLRNTRVVIRIAE